jgi:hypothetical protein
VTPSKSEKSGKSEQYSAEVETDDDLLDLDLGPDAEAESDADLIKALDSDFVAPTPAPQDAEWLADFKALARKHRPFSTVQMVQILRVLNAVEDVALEACR